MTVQPMIVLKCTRRMYLNILMPSKKGLFYLSSNNDAVLVKTEEDNINESTVRK